MFNFKYYIFCYSKIFRSIEVKAKYKKIYILLQLNRKHNSTLQTLSDVSIVTWFISDLRIQAIYALFDYRTIFQNNCSTTI